MRVFGALGGPTMTIRWLSAQVAHLRAHGSTALRDVLRLWFGRAGASPLGRPQHSGGSDAFRVLAVVLALFVAAPAFAEGGGLPSATMILLAFIVLAPTMWFMFRAYRHCQFGVVAVTNDNAEAMVRFVETLEYANSELLIHDDGDKVEGSVYDDDSVIQAVRDRLAECPNLRIRCLLNFKEDVKVAKLSEEFNERFQVRYLHQRPVGDIHFKIADHGKWAYLSTHRQGALERDGEVCDGRSASERVRQYYVGDLLEAFNEGFEKAHLQ